MLPRLLLALLLACAAGAPRADEGRALAAHDAAAQPWSYAVLLDRSADKAERAAHLERLKAWAASGDRASRYLLGTLYRLGRKHPARLLPHDADQAAALLGHAALDGHVQAMAGLAELELEAGRPLAGMMWAQAFVTFGELAGQDSDGGVGPYAAWLIHRLTEAIRTLEGADAELVRETWQGFLNDYGERLADAVQNGGRMRAANLEFAAPQLPLRQEASGSGLALGGIKSWRMDRGPREPGYATYLIGVEPSGKIGKAWVVDSAPNGKVGSGLLRNLYAGRYNAVAEDAPVRWGMVTVYFDDGSTSLRR